MPTERLTTPGVRRTTSALALALLLTGCGGSSADPPRPSATATYLPGLAAQTYLPAARKDRGLPVVVLVPGGGWQTADPTGMRPLAAELARHGVPAVTISYRAAGDGVLLPRSIEDIRCAARFAATTTATSPESLRPVVLLGHSSGAHLAAVAALSPASRLTATCPAGASGDARIVGLVGLAGPYEIRGFTAEVTPLVGTSPARDRASWAAADPIALAGAAPAGLRVLLLHGTADEVVPSEMTDAFGNALRSAGVDVTVRPVDGADHLSLFTAPVAGGPVMAWLDRP